MGKEGSFDVTDSTESKKATKISLLKNVVIVILAIVVVALAIALSRRSSSTTSENDAFTGRPLPPSPKNRRGVCMSQDCIAASNTLFERMNLSVDPCDDFFEFTCGRFLKETIIPPDKTSWTSFSPLSDLILERGRKLLEEENSDDDWNIVKQAKNLYQSCMDEELLEIIGVAPIQGSLVGIGGWPVLAGGSWDEDGFEWTKMVKIASRLGFGKDYIVDTSIGTDDRNSSARVIFVDQPSLGIGREYLVKGFNDENVQHYFTYMKDTAILLGADPQTAEEELAEALKFEISLAEASAPREERRNLTKLYNPVRINEYKAFTDTEFSFSWFKYLSDIFANVVLEEDERIVIVDPEYLKKAGEMLKSKAKSKVIANYLGWRMVKTSMKKMNKAAAEINLKFEKALYGKESEPPRWKYCTRAVGFSTFYSSSNLIMAAGSMYAKRYFPSEAKQAMLMMIDYLKKSFARILDSLDWMDKSTKEKARKKLDKMSQFIGYPDELLDEEKMEAHHEGVDMKTDDFFRNSLQLINWRRKFVHGRLRQAVDKKDWRSHATVAVVNAFYNPSINAMEFPAGILQGIFYNHLVPNALNFGGIGIVIGHEITHGFDDRGRQYDADGNLLDWWEEDTKKKFIDKTKCIIEQYGKYEVKQVGLNLNGQTTQGENIADNGGIKEAYGAYEMFIRDNGEEETLPGLEYTARQLFWINWGQVWCSKFRDGAMENQIKTSSHSPGLYRVIGTVSNSEQFSKDFKCPLGSRMNPGHKCTVW